ncbi:MAG TPA: LuxR C-terminal-related transcriptional regulator [Pyrinomonadaceae bacterium]
MIHSFDDWRKELRDVDAELISLLQRRLELAIEFLQLLHTDESSLGDLDQDTLRLGILLSSDYKEGFPPLDEAAVERIFRRIVIETRRLASSTIAASVNEDTKMTAREREVLILIAEDHSLKSIALALKISIKTVEAHKATIMRKLNIHSSVGLTRYAISEGLISL